MNTISYELHSSVKDQFGAIASIYFSPINEHFVVYKDKEGNKFFEEKYTKNSIDEVENLVIAWAKGKRNLA